MRLNYIWMPSTLYFHMPNRHLKKQQNMQGHHAFNSRPKADSLMPGASSSETQQSPMPLSSCLPYSKKGCHTVHPALWPNGIRLCNSWTHPGKSMGIRSAPHMPEIPPDVGTRVLLLKCSILEAPTGSSNPFPFSPNCK